MRITLLIIVLFSFASGVSAVFQRDYLHIVGSTTVSPFSNAVVERFVEATTLDNPLVQPTGTGGGLMLFCAGVGVLEPDIALASRRIRNAEIKTCRQNDVTEIVELKIGYDGIVMASSNEATPLSLSLQDIFLALAKEVPDPKGTKTLVANPYKTWNEVNEALPKQAIEVLGPMSGSGTYTLFRRLAMEGGCKTFDWIVALKKQDRQKYRTVCRTLREDGVYIDAGENDGFIVARLDASPDALAILSFGALTQNRDKLRSIAINTVKPDVKTIADDSYALERSLYLYVKKAHIDLVPGIREFLAEFTSDKAWGDDGYLAKQGLVPMPSDERAVFAKMAKDLTLISK